MSYPLLIKDYEENAADFLGSRSQALAKTARPYSGGRALVVAAAEFVASARPLLFIPVLYYYNSPALHVSSDCRETVPKVT